jgi:hypothetical protein
MRPSGIWQEDQISYLSEEFTFPSDQSVDAPSIFPGKAHPPFMMD